MTALTIAVTEVRRLMRDRSNLFFVLLLPLMLVLFIGTSITMGPSISVAGEGRFADDLRAGLADTGAFEQVVHADSDRARDDVAHTTVAATVLVPDDTDERLGAGEEVLVRVVAHDETRALGVSQVAARVAIDLTAQLDAARLAVAASDVSFADALAAAETRMPPPSTVTVTTVGGDPLAREFASMGQFDLGASSQLILFTFLTALAGATALIRTRELGIATRLRSTPTSLATLLTGQAAGRIGVAAFQALYIVVATTVLFAASWGRPLATAAVIGMFVIVSGGFGMLVGSIARTEAQAGGLGVGLGIGLGALGGSMIPLEVMPDTLARVALFTPHGWANRAMAEVVRRDGGIADVAVELAVLAGFAAASLTVAVLALRRQLARG